MNARLVYTTGPGGGSRGASSCPRCNNEPCRCVPARSEEASRQSVRVRREKSGRKGKTVTVATPFVLTRDDAQALLKQLKKLCGSGGALKPGRGPDGSACFDLEIQGDHADRVVARLVELGYPAKRAGG